jgi:hypothetical protein
MKDEEIMKKLKKQYPNSTVFKGPRRTFFLHDPVNCTVWFVTAKPVVITSPMSGEKKPNVEFETKQVE